MKSINRIFVLCFSIAVLILETGCDGPWAFVVGYHGPEAVARYVIVRCVPGMKKLQVYYAVQEPPSQIFFQDGFNETPVENAALNGRPCSVSDENQNRPFTISEAVEKGLIAPPPQDGRSTSVPVSRPPSLVNTFPTLVPLLFGPSFPAEDAGKELIGCPSTLGAYLVNHRQGTVTAFGMCPMRVFKEITVRSNPLQVAITPDGSLALVTSYDGAVTFIDTATDTIKATLDIPNFNPSGIAISPDSTRAYVTHYLDQLPVLLVIDIPNRKLLSTIALPRAYPRVVILTPDGSQAWINYYSDRIVTIVDLFTATVAGTVDTSVLASTGMAFNTTGTKAFIAVYPDQVYVVDTATLETVAKLTVGQAPSDIAITSDGKRMFVTSETQPGTWWIDPSINKVIGHSVPAGETTGGSQGLMVYH